MRTYKTTRGGNTLAIVLVIAALIALGGGALLYSGSSEEDAAMKDGEAMMEEEGAMHDDAMMEEGAMMEKDGEAMMEESSAMKADYQGQVLAESGEAVLLDFNKADYDKAVASGNLVALYFFAEWCPICQAEFPKMQAAFNELSGETVVGFRVNYNDNNTDADEKALAREFGVAYQHTKVFTKGGERVLKSPESWEKSRYLSEINKFAN